MNVSKLNKDRATALKRPAKSDASSCTCIAWKFSLGKFNLYLKQPIIEPLLARQQGNLRHFPWAVPSCKRWPNRTSDRKVRKTDHHMVLNPKGQKQGDAAVGAVCVWTCRSIKNHGFCGISENACDLRLMGKKFVSQLFFLAAGVTPLTKVNNPPPPPPTPPPLRTHSSSTEEHHLCLQASSTEEHHLCLQATTKVNNPPPTPPPQTPYEHIHHPPKNIIFVCKHHPPKNIIFVCKQQRRLITPPHPPPPHPPYEHIHHPPKNIIFVCKHHPPKNIIFVCKQQRRLITPPPTPPPETPRQEFPQNGDVVNAHRSNAGAPKNNSLVSYLTKLCHFAPPPPLGGRGKMAELRFKKNGRPKGLQCTTYWLWHDCYSVLHLAVAIPVLPGCVFPILTAFGEERQVSSERKQTFESQKALFKALCLIVVGFLRSRTPS